jgi:hypothetical protein
MKNANRGLTMRSHILSALFAAIVVACAVLWSPSGQTPAQAGTIDFVSLHNQASSALHMLQTAQERRMASVTAGHSEF